MQRGRNLLELPRRVPLLPQKSLSRALCPYLGEPLLVPGVQRHLPGAALLGGVQVHEHPLRQDRALRHLPDPGHHHLPQYHQHLPDQVWQRERGVLPEANQRRERNAGAGEVPLRPQGAHRGPGDADSEQPELPHELGAAVNDHSGTLRLLVLAVTLHWHSQQPKNSIGKKALTIFIYRFCSLLLKEFV